MKHIVKLNHMDYYPQSLSDNLKKLGNLMEYDDEPTPEETVKRLKKADIAIVNWYTQIDRDVLKKVPNLKYIVVPLSDASNIDLEACEEFGVSVSNIAGYSTRSVAEHVFALLFALDRKICLADKLVRDGKRWFYEPFLGMELFGKTLGVLGLGRIGLEVAKIGQGLGMKVIQTSRTIKKQPGIQDVTLNDLLRLSDVLVITVEVNSTTKNMLTRDKLLLMKPTAYLITITGGVNAGEGIMDEQALYELLEEGKIGGAGLDSQTPECPVVNSTKAVFSPGIAWRTQDALDRMEEFIVDDVRNCIQGTPKNLVTKPKLTRK